jgi:hypothetical protein
MPVLQDLMVNPILAMVEAEEEEEAASMVDKAVYLDLGTMADIAALED